MENITFNLAQLHKHGSAFYDFLALRKRFFVDQLGWDIPHDDDVEMDQYDNPKAYYSLVLKDGLVVGGARIMATTAQWGTHTYMLRDAVDGKLGGIPSDIIADAEVTKNIWEVTRVVISEVLATQVERTECLTLMLDGCTDIARSQGASELMSLSPVAMARTLRKLGYAAKHIGEPYRNAEDGRRYACISMPAKRRSPSKPRAIVTTATLPGAIMPPAALPQATHGSEPQRVHAPSVI